MEKFECHWFSGFSETHLLTSVWVCLWVLMCSTYSVFSCSSFYSFLLYFSPGFYVGNQFCYFKALPTTSIFKGFQNCLLYRRKQAPTEISDQKERVMIVAETVCGISACKNTNIQYTQTHFFFHVALLFCFP